MSNNKYPFSSELNPSNNVINSTEGSDLSFEIEAVEGGYSIKNLSTDLYVKSNGGSTTNVNESSTVHVWTIASGTHGTFRFTSTTGRLLAARAGSTNVFGGYAASNVTASSTEYFDVELYRAFTAEDFANHMLNKITCNASGTSAPTFAAGYSWSVLSTEFTGKLTSSEQAILHDASANENGNIVEKAVAKYDYIVGKYGTSSYSNFINRNITPIGGAKIALNKVSENTNTIAAIVIISLVSVTAIGGYFFIRRRKVN